MNPQEGELNVGMQGYYRLVHLIARSLCDYYDFGQSLFLGLIFYLRQTPFSQRYPYAQVTA